MRTHLQEELEMPENLPFTVSSFYGFISEKRLMAAKCNECGTVLLPPKPMCTHCLSTNLKWIELDGAGKLISYTVIHVAPTVSVSGTLHCWHRRIKERSSAARNDLWRGPRKNQGGNEPKNRF